MKKLIKAIVYSFALTGCVSQADVSPESLTKQYVDRMEKQYSGKHQIDRDYLSNQTREVINEAWGSGVKDKIEGMSKEYAQEHVDYYHNYEKSQMHNVPAGEDVAIGIIRFYATMSPELAKAYWGGYTSK